MPDIENACTPCPGASAFTPAYSPGRRTFESSQFRPFQARTGPGAGEPAIRGTAGDQGTADSPARAGVVSACSGRHDARATIASMVKAERDPTRSSTLFVIELPSKGPRGRPDTLCGRSVRRPLHASPQRRVRFGPYGSQLSFARQSSSRYVPCMNVISRRGLVSTLTWLVKRRRLLRSNAPRRLPAARYFSCSDSMAIATYNAS